MTCPHEYHERESSVATEGYCPLCMVAEIERLTGELAKSKEHVKLLSAEVKRLRAEKRK